MIANHISDKGLISKYIKNSFNSITNKQINNVIKKGAEDLNRHISKEDIQMANKYIKKMFNITIRETQTKTTRYHLTPVKMAIIKKTRNNKCW